VLKGLSSERPFLFLVVVKVLNEYTGGNFKRKEKVISSLRSHLMIVMTFNSNALQEIDL
jgi:hypothetical protein